MRATIAFVFMILVAPAVTAAEPDASKLEFFEKKVRPILVKHCYQCHSADTKPAGGLRVDDKAGLLNGGNAGPAIVPGKPGESLLIKRVTQKDEKRKMPLEGVKLTDEEIGVLKTWIADGAAWPAVKIPSGVGKLKPEFEKLKREHWAFQPLANPKPPTVTDAAWPTDSIDRFVLAKLEANKLRPVADADRTALIRRLKFDLLGLPPTPAEIEAFVADKSPDAYAKLVDGFLKSPQFGERWGRHWLDVARYGESTGPSRNIPYPHAWKYRDYVVDSVSNDVPYNRFLREQIAGDLLPAANAAERDRLLTATGFLALGVKDVNQRFKVRFIMDNVDEQIDAVTRSTLALTVSCARCHDHKFDPITQTEYYALAGIFTSTDNAAGVRNKMGGGGLDYYDPAMLVKMSSAPPPVQKEILAKITAERDEAKKAWDAIRGTPEGLKLAENGQPTQRPFRLKYEKLEADLLALSDPAARGFAVHGVRDAKVIADTEFRVRGEAEKLGPTIPRANLTTFHVPGIAPIDAKQSGRLQLADWLTNDKNPLTPRVAVNRIWQNLFGEGIVSSADNFGVTGATPTNPELLDYLASAYVADGWSTKKLIRRIVLSRTYRLCAETNATAAKVDPSNKLLWRHAPRRLDADELRDAVLATSGRLDAKRPAGSPTQSLKMIEMNDNGNEAKTLRDAANASRVRSVYLPLVRGVTPANLEAFDPVDQTLVSGRRDVTTVPAQALFLLNSNFVRRNSLALAESLLKEADDAKRIHAAYSTVLGRTPVEKEIERVKTFLADYESAYRENPPVYAEKPKPKPKPAGEPPLDPDQADQSGVELADDAVKPKDARTAAWLAFVQALYASAEFRYLK